MKLTPALLRLLDLVASPAVLAASALMRTIRKNGFERLPLTRRILFGVGVFPITNHYYEPLFDTRGLKSLEAARPLPGIDWNEAGQLELLSRFHYNSELLAMPASDFVNPNFLSGDSEFLYNVIRDAKPRRIVEIGSGYSTRMAIKAVKANRAAGGTECTHTCIEPYEMPWLEQEPVKVVRRKVEEVDLSLFAELEANDILFIDSSHMIRPQGDVLVEFLQIVPMLKPGVIVHVHDIFSPFDYPQKWVVDFTRFWNEQYLLEAFLSHNRDWKIIGALNYLQHYHGAALREKCPHLTPERVPGSFWMQRL